MPIPFHTCIPVHVYLLLLAYQVYMFLSQQCTSICRIMVLDLVLKDSTVLVHVGVLGTWVACTECFGLFGMWAFQDIMRNARPSRNVISTQSVYLYNCPPFEATSGWCPRIEKNSLFFCLAAAASSFCFCLVAAASSFYDSGRILKPGIFLSGRWED